MKKKGLIISTVVMVVVLIASLTTATYAWFSSTAQVTVNDLSITTIAADGLQIALKNGDNSYVSGTDLTYQNGTWAGSSDTWGSQLQFREFTEGGDNDGVVEFAGMTDAVTRVTDANKAYVVDKGNATTFTYANYKDVTLYSAETCDEGEIVWRANGAEGTWATAFAGVTGSKLFAKFPQNTFLVPTGYDAAIHQQDLEQQK